MGFGQNTKFRRLKSGPRSGYFPKERNPDLTPRGQQQEALDAIEKWLLSERWSQLIFRLDGPAGTGKSALIGFLLERLIALYSEEYLFEAKRDPGQKEWEATTSVMLAAPTHKAAREAEGKLHPFGIHKPFETTARLLKLVETHCSVTGKQEFVQEEPPTWSSQTDLLIVDENSMINQYQFDRLVDAIKAVNYKREIVGYRRPARLLLVGDRRQLTPVAEPLNSSFKDEEISSFELTEVLRHDGSILDLSCKIRAIPNGVPIFRTVGDGAQVRTYSNRDKWEWEFLASVKEHYGSNNDRLGALSAVQAVARTRKRVSQLAEQARVALYGINPPRFVVGELLVSTDAVSEYNRPGRDGLLANSTVYMTVDKVSEVQLNPKDALSGVSGLSDWHLFDITCYQLDVSLAHAVDRQTGKPKKIRFTVVHEQDLDRYKATLAVMQRTIPKYEDKSYRRQMWREVFYPYKAMNAPVESALAITVHRSQGSTIKTVFVDYDNIMHTTQSGFELNRTAYTAVTRASERLVILDSRSKRSR